MADYTDGNKKPTEKNDRERMKDIIECKNDGKDITKEEDYVDDDVETETKPEKPKKETPQEKHNDDAYETEDEDGNTIYVSETIDYDVFKESLKSPRHGVSINRTIDSASSGSTYLKNQMSEPKFQKKFQGIVSKTVSIEFKDGKIAGFDSFQEQMEYDGVPSDEVDKYDNWEAAVNYTFAKHPEKFEGVEELEEAIELQKEVNEARKKSYEDSTYLWRGMDIEELEVGGDGIKEGQGVDQSWSLDPKASMDFMNSGEENGKTMILMRVPKKTDGMYDVNYSVLKRDDDFEKFTSQGLGYLDEQEYRLKNRDMSNIMDSVVMVNDYGMSEAERKSIRERISSHKVVFRRLD